ncbi:MAG: hypothetical protein AAF961_17195, partial [Planctomycetota bacterium]
ESVGGHVDGVGPDAAHPFVIRNFKAWDSHWCFHAGSPAVHVRGMDLFNGQYGIWRSVMSLHFYENLTIRRMEAATISFPMGGYGPRIGLADGKPSFPIIKPIDDLPPATIVTGVRRVGDALRVIGVAIEDGDVASVQVNGVEAIATDDNFRQWTATAPVSMFGDGAIRAHAIDAAGNVEPQPHIVLLDVEERGLAAHAR